MNLSQKLYYQKYLSKITVFEEGDPTENPWVKGAPQIENIKVVEYDPDWKMLFTEQKKAIVKKLNSIALKVEHVGSTAVPNLSAKPVIDIDLIVSDPEKEELYVPLLKELGFSLTIREPSWYQHRMLRLTEPRVNLHIFGVDCPEHIRHILFRDWLISNTDDMKLYQQVKKEALFNVDNVQSYNQKKQDVVRDIYYRIFSYIAK